MQFHTAGRPHLSQDLLLRTACYYCDHFPRKSQTKLAEMFTFNPDGYIIFGRRLWDPFLSAVVVGTPPPGSSRRKHKSRLILSHGAAYFAGKMLAITQNIFDGDDLLWKALRVRSLSSSPKLETIPSSTMPRTTTKCMQPHQISGSCMRYSPAEVHSRTPNLQGKAQLCTP